MDHFGSFHSFVLESRISISTEKILAKNKHILKNPLGSHQEGLHQSILEEASSNQNHMRGAPSDNSQSQHYHGESSTAAAAAATASGTSGTEEQIASDFEYAKRLQEMEDLSIEDDGMVCLG